MIYLYKWKNHKEASGEKQYIVHRQYQFIGDDIDLYWSVKDVRHNHLDPQYRETITVYDRAHVSNIKARILHIESTELKDAISVFCE